MNKSIKNVVYGLLGQMIILALGIIIPRFILQNYGDETNGLINAINQMFAYLALIEAGVGQAALQALYKPVVEKNSKSISAIMSATQQHYCRLTWFYAGAVFLFALIYPMVIDVEETSVISFGGSTYWAVFLMIALQGVSGVISFCVVAACKQLFLADGRNYIISNLTTLTQVLTALVKLVLISLSANIICLQMSCLAVNAVVALIYYNYFRRTYSQVDIHAEPDRSALLQKNAFLVHEVSNAVFSSTDLILLSIFCDLKVASIYAVYNLVFSALNQLIGQVHNGCFYILGQEYNVNKEAYPRIHDTYDTIYVAIVFTLITAAYLLINPFVEIYTRGVSDIKYVDHYLPMLFALIQLLSCCRITASNLVKIAGYAPQTVSRSMTEAVINLLVSIVLVQFFEVYGVLLGTISALIYRTNDFIIYSNLVILRRSPLRQYVMVGCNFFLFGCVAYLFRNVHIRLDNYLQFVILGVVLTIGLALIYFGFALLYNADVRSCLFRISDKLIYRRKKNDF